MVGRKLIAFSGVFLALSLAAVAQENNFNGTWVLDTNRSRLTPGGGLARIGDGGAPQRLHVTHSLNGDVTLLSEVNESQARTYKLNAESTIPVTQDADMSVVARWNGPRLVVEGTRVDGGSAAVTAVRRTLELSSNGSVLTIDVSTTSSDTEQSSRLVYNRTTTVPACEEWSTPCLP